MGPGDALTFGAGTGVKAKWMNSTVGSVTTYTDSAGMPIPLSPGQTSIHLMEPGAARGSG